MILNRVIYKETNPEIGRIWIRETRGLKKGLFGPPLRVGQIGKELYLAHAKPS